MCSDIFACEFKNKSPMERFIKICAAVLLLAACSKEGEYDGQSASLGNDGLQHEMIVLGGKLDNPYKTETVQKAFSALYPARDRELVNTTNLYVRFLPSSQEEFDKLEELGLELLDHPVDYEVVTEGDYYHDPEVEEGRITWQYAVVDKNFEFPNVKYEIIEECFISENSETTKAMSDVDWDAVEAEAYRISGNESLLADATDTRSTKYKPSGRLTIVDNEANGAQPFGIAGVKVSCNSFVKFASAYTDRDGYYTMSKGFSSKLRYRIIFKNQQGFSIGVNLILVSASVSTLGKNAPTGIDRTVTRDSEDKLFRRCVVNNAAYDYYSRCTTEDMNLMTPPGNLRIWLFKSLTASSAVMLHHGAIIDNNLFRKYLGIYSLLVKFFAPDITIGTKNHKTYADIYDEVVHEMSHASHFRQVGTKYWNNYAYHIVSSFLVSGGETYGYGTESNAGYCEVGEMWGYYIESEMHKDRYGGSTPAYGEQWWFHPQIFKNLEDRGFSRSEIFDALQSDIYDRQSLQRKMVSMYPDRKTTIEQVFSRYK